MITGAMLGMNWLGYASFVMTNPMLYCIVCMLVEFMQLPCSDLLTGTMILSISEKDASIKNNCACEINFFL